MRKWRINPTHENRANDQRSEKTRDRPFPRFLGTQVRRKRVLTYSSANEIRRGVANPRNHQGKKQKYWALSPKSVKADRIRQWERHEEQCTCANAGPRKCFDQRP